MYIAEEFAFDSTPWSYQPFQPASRMTFDLHQEILHLQESDIQFATSEFVVAEYGAREVDKKLDFLVDKILDEPSCLLVNDEMRDMVLSLVKHFESLTDEQKTKFSDMVYSGMIISHYSLFSYRHLLIRFMIIQPSKTLFVSFIKS